MTRFLVSDDRLVEERLIQTWVLPVRSKVNIWIELLFN